MAFLTLAALSLALPVTTVDVHEPGLPLGLLLPKLSAQLRRPLTVQPTLAREWILIDADDVAPDDLLARIAEVTHADWVTQNGEFRLERSPARERALATAANEFHAANLRRELHRTLPADYSGEAAAHALSRALLAENRDAVERAKWLDQRPDKVFVAPIVATLPVEKILALPEGHRIIYSTKPQGVQLPFPDASKALLSRYLQEAASYEELRRTYDRNAVKPRQVGQVLLYVDHNSLDSGRRGIGGKLVRFDSTGKMIASGRELFISRPEPAGPFPSPLAMPPDAIRTGMGWVQGDEGDFSAASPEVRNAILSPDRDGDLVRVWGAAVRALGRHERKRVVANLADELSHRADDNA